MNNARMNAMDHICNNLSMEEFEHTSMVTRSYSLQFPAGDFRADSPSVDLRAENTRLQEQLIKKQKEVEEMQAMEYEKKMKCWIDVADCKLKLEGQRLDKLEMRERYERKIELAYEREKSSLMGLEESNRELEACRGELDACRRELQACGRERYERRIELAYEREMRSLMQLEECKKELKACRLRELRYEAGRGDGLREYGMESRNEEDGDGYGRESMCEEDGGREMEKGMVHLCRERGGGEGVVYGKIMMDRLAGIGQATNGMEMKESEHVHDNRKMGCFSFVRRIFNCLRKMTKKPRNATAVNNVT